MSLRWLRLNRVADVLFISLLERRKGTNGSLQGPSGSLGLTRPNRDASDQLVQKLLKVQTTTSLGRPLSHRNVEHLYPHLSDTHTSNQRAAKYRLLLKVAA